MKPPNEHPSAAETGQLRAYLARNKVPPEVANELVKMTRTRAENASLIAAYCRELRKTKVGKNG